MICGRQSSPYMMFTILGSDSTVFMEGTSMVQENTSSGNAIFLAAALASSSTFAFFFPFDILNCEPLEIILHPPGRWLSIFLRYHLLSCIPFRSGSLSL
jgi:hypothetical protein